MKLRVTRAASAFILAATLLAGCGEPADQSSYAPSAIQAAEAAQSVAQATRSAAQSVVSGAKKATSEDGSDVLSQWPQPLQTLRSAGSAATSGASVADWWRSIFNRFANEDHGLAGGGKILEFQPQPR